MNAKWRPMSQGLYIHTTSNEAHHLPRLVFFFPLWGFDFGDFLSFYLAGARLPNAMAYSSAFILFRSSMYELNSRPILTTRSRWSALIFSFLSWARARAVRTLLRIWRPLSR